MVQFLAQSKCSVSNGKEGERESGDKLEKRERNPVKLAFLKLSVTRGLNVEERSLLIKIILVTEFEQEGTMLGLLLQILPRTSLSLTFKVRKPRHRDVKSFHAGRAGLRAPVCDTQTVCFLPSTSSAFSSYSPHWLPPASGCR